jgi:hypothetical protein
LPERFQKFPDAFFVALIRFNGQWTGGLRRRCRSSPRAWRTPPAFGGGLGPDLKENCDREKEQDQESAEVRRRDHRFRPFNFYFLLFS